MVTFLLIIGLIISLGVIVLTCIIINRLLSRIDTYEKWILEFKMDLVNTLESMRAIDIKNLFATSANDERGAMESDDQVGHIFKEMLDLVEKLNERTQ